MRDVGDGVGIDQAALLVAKLASMQTWAFALGYLPMSIFRSYRHRHTALLFKLQGNAAATLAPGVAFQEKNVFRSSKMSFSNSNITTELIADFAAGRLNNEDTRAVQEAIDHDQVIATAVLDARRVASRMNVWLAIPALATPAPGADRTRAAHLQ
jgi:hypothetical protein